NLESGASLPAETVDFQLDLRDVRMHYMSEMPPMQIEQANVRVAGQRFFFDAPKAEVIAPSGETLYLSDGQFIIGDLRPFIPEGEIHFKSESSAGAVLSLLDHPKLGYISKLDMPLPEIDAKASSSFSLSLTMVKDLKFEHIKMNGRTVLDNVRATNLGGGFGVHGGTVAFDVTSDGFEAEGELSVNGMPILAAWRYQFNAPLQHQSPLKLRTVLDAKARQELGLEANDMLSGPIATEVAVNFRENAEPSLDIRLNLKDAELKVSSLGWSKPVGAAAAMNLKVEPADDGGRELRDISLVGDDFSVRGAIRLNEDKKPVAFNLPLVSLGPQTQVRMRGELSNEVWKIFLRGKSFDGRTMFRSLLSAGKVQAPRARPPGVTPGLDVDAEIDRVIGFFDTTLDTVKLTASRRNNTLAALDVSGRLNGNRPFAAKVEQRAGQARRLIAQATDAGAAFRLVGFYPSARGGAATLNVNLDEGRNNQRTGSLFAQDFVIVRDQIVAEVLSSSQAQATNSQNQPLLQFDRMQVPFSVGNGRFEVRDALINGPVLGVTMRGSIDFASENINLTGAYVPLYGINGALGSVPIISDLLVGRNGEGVFSITFAVRGNTSKPDVLVNPVSLVAPGILRQIFEFNENLPPQGGPRQKIETRPDSIPGSLQLNTQ
nr:hypothetical protein [Hyphomicrobiales bacterium]